MPEALIEIKNLIKSFGRKRVLKGVNLKIKKGEFLTLFGPNGAGKTTLLKTVATVINPDRGEIIVNGSKLSEEAIEIRRKVGFVSHNPLLYDDLTSEENLKFYARMYEVKDYERKIDFLLKKVGLFHRKYDLVRTFSRGMLQRLAIARTLVHDPEILLLDEPYTGLDPGASNMLDELLSALKEEGHTFFMTSHDLEKGYNLATRVAVIVDGEIMLDRGKEEVSLEDLKDYYWEKVEVS
jgi:heme exporter protein A